MSVDEPPANYINENGEPEGYAVDIVNALLSEIGFSGNIIFVPEARALKIISTQPNTILFSISKTPFRENLYHWIGHIFTKKWQVYALKESNLTINSLEELKQLPMLGLVRGDVREEWLVNRRFTNLHSVTHHVQNVQSLFLKRTSAIVYEESGLSRQISKIKQDESLVESIYTIHESPVYIAMSTLTKPHDLNMWQNAFNVLIEKRELKKISEKWKKKLKEEFNINSKLSNQLLVL